MKRKWAYLALPLLLAALIFGAKWRAEHPTPTKLDLEIRAMMAKAGSVEVSVVRYRLRSIHPNSLAISKQEQKELLACFYISSNQKMRTITPPNAISLKFHLRKEFTAKNTSAYVYAEVSDKNSHVIVPDKYGDILYYLHPVTAKRWMKFLLANPRIGPELRARMK